ncbi:Cyclic nucleotide-gated cation channel alpha-3 [Aphelenchoides besseyi]|nr:Cyclic nucleotide-gated cation channel alpha-3 [Aphelenchoides besseyi]
MNKQKKSNFRLIVKRFNQLWKSTVNPLGSFYYYFLLLVTVNALYNIVGCSILSRVMYLKHGIWVTKREKTLRRYIKKKTFYLDVVAIIPVDLLLFVWPELSLLRLNRLAKLHRAADFTNRIEVRTELPHMFRLLRLVVICFSIFHLNCCAYHEFSYVYNNLDATVNDWVYSPAKIPNLRYANCDARYNVGSCTMNESNRNFWKRDLYIDDLRSYWENRFNETDFGQFTRKYTLSFYWSALTLTTLGEQPWPNNSPEMIFETLDTIVGLLLFAIILGQIGSMVSHMNAARTQFEEVHDGCKRYMNYRRVESSVQSRVFRFLGFSGVKGQTMLSEQEVASSLPPRLHSELMADVHLQTLKDVEMFADCEVSLLTELAQKLQLQTFCPGDVICRNEDAGKKQNQQRR